MDTITTKIIYISAVMISTCFAAFSQKRELIDNRTKISFRKTWFIFAFLVSFFIATFNKVGVDYENYCYIIQYSYKFLEKSLVECGFNGLAYCLYKIFLDIDIVYCLIKGIAVIIFYKAFYNLKEDVPLWMTVFCYNVLAFFYFFLLSMTLASAFMTLSISYLIKKKDLKAIICLFIACLIHSSCILTIPAYILYYVFGKNKDKKISRAKIILLVIMYLIIILFSTFFFNILVNNVEALKQYSIYRRYSNSGIGLMFIVRYIPIIYFIYKIYLKNEDNEITNVAIIFTLTNIFFVLLGYQFNVISRMYEHFIAIQCFFIPYYCMQIRNKKGIYNVSKITEDELIWIIYMFIIGGYDFFTIVNYAGNMISEFAFYNPF